MSQILQLFQHAGLAEIILYGLLINFGIYLCSLAIYSGLSYVPNKQSLGDQHPVFLSDILLSMVTVFCNTLVFILGVFLWKTGFIRLDSGSGFLQIVLEVLFLIVIMDFLMYVFHRSVHLLRYFSKIHQRHHEHESTNLLSLFVLHPIESIGFGLMMLAVIYVFPFTALGISMYLVINSLWGTIGHLNHTVLPLSWINAAKKACICTSEFHYLHHQYPGTNFGFYTAIWDVLLKTVHPSLKKQ